MSNYKPGTITVERNYAFVCGRCGAEDSDVRHSMAAAMRLFRMKGWSLTGKDGWVCPNCTGATTKAAL